MSSFVRWSLVALSATILVSVTPDAALAGVSLDERATVTDNAGNRVRLPVRAARPPATQAGGAAWTALGPYGGDVTAAAFSPTDPNLALAGVAPSGGFGGSLYRSTEGGATWSRVPALAGHSVYDVEFTAAGKAYVGAIDGVWTSDNGGVSWTQHVLPIGINQQVFDVELDPTNPLVVWVGVGDAIGTQTQVVLRSADGGDNWVDRTPPLSTVMSCTALAVRPGAPDTVVAVFSGDFSGGGVWVTTNGGASWTNRSPGLPANPMRTVDFAGTRLLVGGGMKFGSQFVGLYGSDNLGASWTPLHDGTWPLRIVLDVAVDPASSNTLLVATEGQGVNRTTNGGTSWEIAIGGTAGLSAQSVRFRPASSTDVLLGTSSLGVYKSTNGGLAFAQSTTGISELDLFSVHVNPANPAEVAVAFQGLNNGGVFSSTNSGATWLLEPLPPTRYSAVRFAPGGALYAISSGPSNVAPEGLYQRKLDGTWTGLGPDQGSVYESDLQALKFSASDPDLILLGGSDFGVAGFESTIWRSTDAGALWTKVHEGDENDFVLDIEIVPDGKDQVMIASYDGQTNSAPQDGGVLRSVDGGQSWAPSLSGLPTFMRTPQLCAPPGNPEAFFLSAYAEPTTGILFRTADGGATWTSTGWAGPLIIDLACDPVSSQRLYIAEFGAEHVATSVNGGVTFTPYDNGLASAGTARELAAATTGSPRLFLASRTGAYVTALPSDLFSDGFESGNTSAWSARTP